MFAFIKFFHNLNKGCTPVQAQLPSYSSFVFIINWMTEFNVEFRQVASNSVIRAASMERSNSLLHMSHYCTNLCRSFGHKQNHTTISMHWRNFNNFQFIVVVISCVSPHPWLTKYRTICFKLLHRSISMRTSHTYTNIALTSITVCYIFVYSLLVVMALFTLYTDRRQKPI